MGWNCCTVAMSASVRNDQSMKAEWALDNASSVHVCNDRSRFITFKAQKSKLLTGDSQTPILGHGTAHFTGIDPQSGKLRVVTLTDAVYSPGFHLSLVSFSKLRRSGAKWDVDNDCIRDELGNTIVSLHEKEKYGLWIFDQPTKKQLRSAPKTLPAFNAFSTLPQSNRAASCRLIRWSSQFACSNIRFLSRQTSSFKTFTSAMRVWRFAIALSRML
jgi:hypothetical protein